MKNINIALEDTEYEELIKRKGDKGWKAFIMEK